MNKIFVNIKLKILLSKKEKEIKNIYRPKFNLKNK